MSGAGQPGGRPAGPTASILDFGEQLLALQIGLSTPDRPISARAIAAALGIDRKRVDYALKQARLGDTGIGWPSGTGPRERPMLRAVETGPADPDTDSEAASVPTPKPRRRPTQKTLLDRAWIVMHLHKGFGFLTAGQRLMWLEAVLAINAHAEDGLTLAFGSVIRSTSEFAIACGGTEPDLDELISREALERAEGGIALPRAYGLRPAERIGGKFMPDVAAMLGVAAPHRASAKGSPARNTEMLLPLPGGAAVAHETGPVAQKTPGFQGEIGPSNGHVTNFAGGFVGHQGVGLGQPGGGFVGHAGLARPGFADADALRERESLLSISSSIDSDSRVGHETHGLAQKTPSVAHETPIAGPAGTAAAFGVPGLDLAVDLAELAGLGRPPNTAEAVLVEGWLAVVPAPTLRLVVKASAARRTGPPSSLQYFDKAVREAAAGLSRGAAVAAESAVPAAPLSPADAALSRRLTALLRVHEPGAGPVPPSLATYREVCSAGRTAEADRWLAVAEALVKSKRGDVRLPDLRMVLQRAADFADDLLAAEDALAAAPAARA